jgi:hypothetical protein
VFRMVKIESDRTGKNSNSVRVLLFRSLELEALRDNESDSSVKHQVLGARSGFQGYQIS